MCCVVLFVSCVCVRDLFLFLQCHSVAVEGHGRVFVAGVWSFVVFVRVVWCVVLFVSCVCACDLFLSLHGGIVYRQWKVFLPSMHSRSCRDGGNTFTPERYKLELNSAHTFTGRQAPSDPHTVSGVFFLRKQN